MRLNRKFVILGVFLVCSLQPHHAQARGSSTAEERAKVIELTRALEREPLAENAAANRQWLRAWIAEVPDIRFKVCTDLLGQGLGNYPYSKEVNLQVLFSGAAFALEHQDKARDDVAVYSAGVEGALRAYEELVKLKPEAKLAFLDDLLAKRDRGELVDHVSRVAGEKCKESNILLIAAPVGAAVGFVLALLVAWWFGGSRAHGVEASERPTRGTPMVNSVRWIVTICAAYYMTIGIALHILEPEYDPRYRFMSEYVWGAYGWLMTTTFFVLGLAIFAVAAGVRQVYQSSWSARTGFGLLVVGAVFICLAGVFKEFTLHGAAGAVGLPSVLMAAFVLSWSFRRASGWRSIYRATLWIAIGMLVAFLSIVVDVGMPGLQQRAFLSLLWLWLLVVAHRLVRATRWLAREFASTSGV